MRSKIQFKYRAQFKINKMIIHKIKIQIYFRFKEIRMLIQLKLKIFWRQIRTK